MAFLAIVEAGSSSCSGPLETLDCEHDGDMRAKPTSKVPADATSLEEYAACVGLGGWKRHSFPSLPEPVMLQSDQAIDALKADEQVILIYRWVVIVVHEIGAGKKEKVPCSFDYKAINSLGFHKDKDYSLEIKISPELAKESKEDGSVLYAESIENRECLYVSIQRQVMIYSTGIRPKLLKQGFINCFGMAEFKKEEKR